MERLFTCSNTGQSKAQSALAQITQRQRDLKDLIAIARLCQRAQAIRLRCERFHGTECGIGCGQSRAALGHSQSLMAS